MTPKRRLLTPLVLLLAAMPAAAQVTAPALPSLVTEQVAPGVELWRLDARQVTREDGPVAVVALRLDTTHVRLALAVARDGLPALETVAAMASRWQAIAAVNAGFFTPAGQPAGLFRVARLGLFRPGAVARAAVAIVEDGTRSRLLVDRVRVGLSSWLAWGQMWPMTWFDPRFGGSPVDWAMAPDVVGGAGLLLAGGRAVDDWTEERLRAGFVLERHPRTMVGVDAGGAVWCVVVDGRQPGHSVGVTLDGLRRIARQFGLVDAANLDGGGSSTLVVRGEVVNRPSDATGPRPVTDAILVLPRAP